MKLYLDRVKGLVDRATANVCRFQGQVSSNQRDGYEPRCFIITVTCVDNLLAIHAVNGVASTIIK